MITTYIIFHIVLIYLAFQVIRIEVIYHIKEKWCCDKDSRFYKYSFEYLIIPNKHNWYGLRFPRDKDYK